MRVLLATLTILVTTVAVASLSAATSINTAPVQQALPCPGDYWYHVCTNVVADPGECYADATVQLVGVRACNTGTPTACTVGASAGVFVSCNNSDRAFVVGCQMCNPSVAAWCTEDLHSLRPSCETRGLEDVERTVGTLITTN